MGNCGSLLMIIEIVISVSIRGLFIGPEVLVCNSVHGTCKI